MYSCFFVCITFFYFFFFKQKTAYEMRISDWSSDVCSSDLDDHLGARTLQLQRDLAPDPVAAAGDQRELSTKFHKTPPMFYLAHYGGSHRHRLHAKEWLARTLPTDSKKKKRPM